MVAFWNRHRIDNCWGHFSANRKSISKSTDLDPFKVKACIHIKYREKPHINHYLVAQRAPNGDQDNTVFHVYLRLFLPYRNSLFRQLSLQPLCFSNERSFQNLPRSADLSPRPGRHPSRVEQPRVLPTTHQAKFGFQQNQVRLSGGTDNPDLHQRGHGHARLVRFVRLADWSWK